MKQFIVICLLLFLSDFYSQGNLQFNQVYNYSGTLSSSTPVTGINYNNSHGMTALVVPNNKVWRIERFWIENGGTMYINNYAAGFSSSVPLEITTPIWMKAGESLRCGAQSQHWYSINIVEFNIIP